MANIKLRSSISIAATRSLSACVRQLVHGSVATAGLFAIYGLFVLDCHAYTVFETATLGPSESTPLSGAGIYFDQFLGVRFDLTSNVSTASIGGHFGTSNTAIGNNQFFGAIVALSDANDFPDSSDLSTPDVLGTTLLTFPRPSADVSAPLFTSLQPGHYALVFGSGLFGATGSGGAAIDDNNQIGTQDWIDYRPAYNWHVSNLNNVRFFITGVPEPHSVSLVAAGAICAFGVCRRRRNATGTLAPATRRFLLGGAIAVGLFAARQSETDAATVTLAPSQILRIDFQTNGPLSQPPDLFYLAWGPNPPLLNATGPRHATLYRGSTVIGEDVDSSYGDYVGPLGLHPSNEWKTASSLWGSGTVVDFVNLFASPQSGRVDFRIESGNMTFDTTDIQLVQGAASSPNAGTVVEPPPTIVSVLLVPEPSSIALIVTALFCICMTNRDLKRGRI
jgi:hypothetical protein